MKLAPLQCGRHAALHFPKLTSPLRPPAALCSSMPWTRGWQLSETRPTRAWKCRCGAVCAVCAELCAVCSQACNLGWAAATWAQGSSQDALQSTLWRVAGRPPACAFPSLPLPLQPPSASPIISKLKQFTHTARPQDCELVYVAFDILHNGTSVLNMEPLETRLRLLRQFVKSGESGERLRRQGACANDS